MSGIIFMAADTPESLPVFLPDPSILRGYHEIDRTIPDAYLQLVWEETQHRRRLERIALDEAQRRASRSQWFTQGSMVAAVLLTGYVLVTIPVLSWPLLLALMTLLCVTWGVPLFVSKQGVHLGMGEGGQPDEPQIFRTTQR